MMIGKVSSQKTVILLLAMLLSLSFSISAQTDKANTDQVKAKEERRDKAAVKSPRFGENCPVNSDRGQKGQWCTVEAFTYPVVAIHTSVLPNGKVIAWGNYLTKSYQSVAQVWDPTGKSPLQTITLSTEFENIFCSGHSFLPDGKLLITGGQEIRNGNQYFTGIDNAAVFDYSTGQFTLLPDMNGRRWYPTNLSLGDGSTLVWGGLTLDGGVNTTPQILEKQVDGSYTWRDVKVTNPEVYNIYYSWLHLSSGGEVMPIIGLYGKSYLLSLGDRFRHKRDFLDLYPTNPANSALNGTLIDAHDAGSSVQYDKDKVVVFGGSDLPKAITEVIDLDSSTPLWSRVGRLNVVRRHLSGTLLADGKVLATGGNKGNGFNNTCSGNAVLTAELWDPDSPGTDPNVGWSVMASATQPRLYHSTAVLLPDGRVMTGGTSAWPAEGVDRLFSGRQVSCKDPVQDNYTIEVYSPPYLYNSDGTEAIRPIIGPVSSTVSYGQTLQFTVTNAGPGSKVNLIRLPSVTHSFDQNQGIVKLEPTVRVQSFTVTLPANRHEFPPGHYMMFVINSSGVPSVSKIIQVL